MVQQYVNPTTVSSSNPAADQPNITSNDQALVTNFSGTTAPAPSFAGQHWADSENDLLFVRSSDNTYWGLCANFNKNLDSTSNFTLTEFHNGMDILISQPMTITLPVFRNTSRSYKVNLIINTSGSVRINGNAGIQFFRNGDLLTSFEFPVNSQNSRLRIFKESLNGYFSVAGELVNLDPNLSDISSTGEKVLLDESSPVGCVRNFWSNITPPLQGILGVSWELIDDGYGFITSSDSTNIKQGTHRFDTGTTANHTLTIQELPAHRHNMDIIKIEGSSPTVNRGASSNRIGTQPPINRGEYVIKNGGSSPHSHVLSIQNYKTLTYRRIS